MSQISTYIPSAHNVEIDYDPNIQESKKDGRKTSNQNEENVETIRLKICRY